MSESDVKLPFLKCMSAWLATMWTFFASTPWELFAQFAAFVYSVILIIEWITKKVRKKTDGTNKTLS